MIIKQTTLLSFILSITYLFPNSLETSLLKSDTLYYSGLYEKSYSEIKRVYNKNDNNVEVVYRMARSIFMKAHEQKQKKTQMSYYYRGLKQAEKAMRLNKDNGYANFWYAAYLGEIGLLESRKQAIKNSYKVKKYAIRSIELEPDFDLPYHMMGRWHYELADLSNLEKKLASLVYGELPKGSYNEAVIFFQNAIRIKPDEIRHHFWLAKTYRSMGNKKLSRDEFRIVISLTPKDQEERMMQKESKKYL